MTLVDELKAALPGWTVTGDDSTADARPSENPNDVCVECWPIGQIGVNARVYARVMPIGWETGDTVKDAVQKVRHAIATDLEFRMMAVNRRQAALNALGGTK